MTGPLTNNNALDGFIYSVFIGYIVLAGCKDNLMLTQITGASVKFIGSKSVFFKRAFINTSLLLYIS